MNDTGYDIYISMNPVKADARGRTKTDIAAIRHIYLDLDQGERKPLPGFWPVPTCRSRTTT